MSVVFGDPTDVWLGRRFASFDVDDVLGKGTVAVVYRALRGSEEFALKVLTPFAEANAQVRTLFEYETSLAGRFDHHNVMPILGGGVFLDTHYLVMPLHEGRTAAELVGRRPRLAPGAVAAIGAGVARGLHHVHERGVVHRDVKPSNLFVTDDAVPLIFDFGLSADAVAAADGDGRVFGSPTYLSPEQALGRGVDGRSDLYGLGATLYRLLAGSAPFQGERADLLHGHVHGVPPPLPHDVPGGLGALVMDLLAKDPADRPTDGDEVAGRLDELDLPDEPLGDEPGPRRWFRRRGR